MSKFNNRLTPGPGQPVVRTATSAVRTTGATIPTHNAGVGYQRDDQSALFILAATSMLEDTAYVSAERGHQLLRELTHRVAGENPWWVADLVEWLRGPANLRSVAATIAVELAAASAGREPWQLRDNVGPVRYAVEAACQRPDEPGELLGYWLTHYPGKQVPKGLKRGLAAAATRLYTERAALKWDKDGAAVRFGDVLELTHPKPARPFQEHLFKYLIDKRHKREIDMTELHRTTSLDVISANHNLRWQVSTNGAVSLLLDQEVIKLAGMTWEDVLSLGGQHGLDKRQMWEAIVPSMGYMALLRNLRNLLQAGVSRATMDAVAARLQDPDEVRKSRQLPTRFLSAHRAIEGHPEFELALERALQTSLMNVPQLPGRTLILVDTSGSMNARMSDRSDLKRWDSAVVFGLALAARCNQADVVAFSDRTMVFKPKRNETLLRQVQRWKNERYFMGSGTDTIRAVANHLKPEHDRLIILTDEQVNGTSWYWRRDDRKLVDVVPATLPTYTWNLAGYDASHLPTGEPDHRWHAFGGLNDHAFRAVPLLEVGTSAGWPWELEQ